MSAARSTRNRSVALRKKPTRATPTVPLDPLVYAASKVTLVDDFPKPGVKFRDITPLLADPKAFHAILDGFAQRFIGGHVDVIAGVEARGFIFGGALAARLNASFVPLRKPGKLPGEVDAVAFDLEYGSTSLEIRDGSIEDGAKVVIVDDVLATGGTALAAAELVRRQGGYVAAFAFAVEIEALGGRAKLAPQDVVALLKL